MKLLIFYVLMAILLQIYLSSTGSQRHDPMSRVSATKSVHPESKTKSVPATLPEEVDAMESLKASLHVPERLVWKGDPCTPFSWEGVTCEQSPNGHGSVISKIDLADKGLKGSISGMIRLLQNLNSINLSSNCLIGEIPRGFENTSLVELDLSNNHLTGSVPQKLSSSTLLRVMLNNNHLTGFFPLEIYSVHVNGGELDFSGNEGLCGFQLPNLPQCSLMVMAFYRKGFALAFGSMVFALSYALHLPMQQYDRNAPNFALIMDYGVFRMTVALYIAAFHVVRFLFLKSVSFVPLADSYISLRFTMMEQTFLVMCVLSTFMLLIRSSLAETRYRHRVTPLSLTLFLTALSASNIVRVYHSHWLLSLERFWMFSHYAVCIALTDMPDSFDFKSFLVNVTGPVGGFLRSLRSNNTYHFLVSFCVMTTVYMSYV